MKDLFKYFEVSKDECGRTKTVVYAPKIILHCVVLSVLLVIVMNSWTTVPAGHVKVKTVFGKVEHDELTEGFHIVNPLASFTAYDARKQTLTITKIAVPAQDKLKSMMDISIIYSAEPSQASNIKQDVGTLGDLEAKLLTPKVRSLVREAGKGVQESQAFFIDSVQQQLQDEVLTELIEFMASKGVAVHNVLIRDIALPNIVVQAITQTKQRQEEVEQEKAKLAIAEQQAQQQVIQAKAKEDAAIAEANAKRTRADAEAYEIETVAKATAKGNDLINKTLTKDLIEAERIKKWDGKYPTTMMSGANGTLLNIPVK